MHNIMPQPNIIYPVKETVNILNAFNKRFKGKLLYHLVVGETISSWEFINTIKRDHIYKAPSIYLQNGMVIPLSEGYTHLYVRDYYKEVCRVIEASGLTTEGDPLQYQLLLNLPKVEFNKASVVLLPYNSVNTAQPHHMILDDEQLEKAMKTAEDPLSIFVQGIRHIANRYIWPDRDIIDSDNYTISGNVTTLFIP